MHIDINENYLFSIIVPTSNRPTTLRNTLEAINKQSYKHFEVLIINNGTRPELVDEYKVIEKTFDQRFIFLNFHNEYAQGFGPAIARNIGIKAAKGQYIAFCDDDDLWINSDYLTNVNALINATQAKVIFSEQKGIKLINNNEIEERPLWFHELINTDFYTQLNEHSGVINFNYFNAKGVFPHLNITVYIKSLLTSLGGFDQALWYEEDLDLFLRVAQQVDKIYLNNQMVAKHYIPNHTTKSNVTSDVDLNKKNLTRNYIANKLLLNQPKKNIKRYAANLIANSAKHSAVQLNKNNEFNTAFFYAKIALITSFGFKWCGYCAYLCIKSLVHHFKKKE